MENGKHVLVEKVDNAKQRRALRGGGACRKNGVIIAEAMTIYHMPLYKKLKAVLDGGKLRQVNLITMNFGSFKDYNMSNRFFNRNLAGGAMLDIGVYALSFYTFLFLTESPPSFCRRSRERPPEWTSRRGFFS